MALLCFLLDLRNIPPPFLHRLKQCLLHLANLYAATTSPPHPVSAAAADGLPDRLALGYVHHVASSNSSSSSSPEMLTRSYCTVLALSFLLTSDDLNFNQLKIAYKPGDKFSLRDFHHAVNNMPLDGFLPEQHGRSLHTGDVPLANLFSNKAIYSWGTDDISKKVIAICMSAQRTEALGSPLMGIPPIIVLYFHRDAAEQCVAVEFVMLDTEASFMYDDVSENADCFENKICDLENYVVRRYNPETQVLHGLVKKWLEELKEDNEETLQAVLMFRDPIINSVKEIYCNLYASTNQIIDGFPSCQACKCHGHPIDLVSTNKAKWLCPITSLQLAAPDVTDTAVRIGERTLLFLPTSEDDSNLRRTSTSISFDVIEQTKLALLNEGVVMGTPHVVIPSSHDVEVALNDERSDQKTNFLSSMSNSFQA